MESSAALAVTAEGRLFGGQRVLLSGRQRGLEWTGELKRDGK